MATISSIVEGVVKSDLRIHDCMRMGIANNRRLAKRIQKRVSDRAGHNISLGTIAVTLQRLSSRLSTESNTLYAKILGSSRLQLRDDITIIYLEGNPPVDAPDDGVGGFYVKLTGIGATTVMIDEANAGNLGYNKDRLIKEITHLSAIIITSPEEIVDTPGVVAHIMMALGGAGINVSEMSSSYRDTFIIVEKKDSLKAVEVMRALIGGR